MPVDSREVDGRDELPGLNVFKRDDEGRVACFYQYPEDRQCSPSFSVPSDAITWREIHSLGKPIKGQNEDN